MSKTSNGLTCATVETNSPLVTVAVGVKSGSRNETPQNRGQNQSKFKSNDQKTPLSTYFLSCRPGAEELRRPVDQDPEQVRHEPGLGRAGQPAQRERRPRADRLLHHRQEGERHCRYENIEIAGHMLNPITRGLLEVGFEGRIKKRPVIRVARGRSKNFHSHLEAILGVKRIGPIRIWPDRGLISPAL